MALSTTPAASSTSSTLTPAAGSNRFAYIEFRAESGSAVTLTSATYGPAGPAAYRVESRPLPGNQMWCHYAFFKEDAIAARTSDVITPTWSATPPTSTTFAAQWPDVDQGLPINDLVEASSPTVGIASPPNITTLNGGVVVLSNGTGTGTTTFTWTNFTQQNSQGAAAYTWVVATRATPTAGSYATEYSVSPAANRSSLLAFSLNEVGSVGVGIAIVNSGSPISPGLANVVITGTSFEASQGTGVITLSPTDNIADTNAVVISSMDSWADTSIQFDMPANPALLFGTIYLFVTNNTAESNINGFPVTLAPEAANQYLTIFTTHDSGILNGIAGIESEADQIEWQILSDQGGTVRIDISGVFSIKYSSAIPATDKIYVRLGDKSDESWSTSTLQEIGINIAAAGSTNITPKCSLQLGLSL